MTRDTFDGDVLPLAGVALSDWYCSPGSDGVDITVCANASTLADAQALMEWMGSNWEPFYAVWHFGLQVRRPVGLGRVAADWLVVVRWMGERW